ncbi:hypothetical protein RQP46_009290 [Phenoliferia psychrophenolica]
MSLPSLSLGQLNAAGDKIQILDEDAVLQQTLPFELAFPIHRQLINNDHDSSIHALAFDNATGRIAAVSRGRVGVWEPSTGAGSSWRVHSSFVVQHNVSILSYANGRIVAADDVATVWELDETQALPTWRRIGIESPSRSLLSARLSPSAQMLATVNMGSNSVRISSIGPKASGSAVEFRSNAWHSLRIRSIGWRPTDDPADSGPILFTTTLDGVFRIWGCMIDEPDFFSLWATLDVHATLPSHIPLSTSFRRTRAMWPKDEEGVQKKGAKDDFVTVFSDGSVWSTTVTNFDCRPPTCLIQSSHLIHPTAFSPSLLSNLLHVLLLPSSPPSSPSSLSLLCRSSLGSLLLADLSAPPIDEPPFSSAPEFFEVPRSVPVNFVGEIGELCKMLAVTSSTGIKVYGFRHHGGRLRLIASSPFPHPLPSPTSPLLAFFVARASLLAPRTTLVAVTSTSSVLTWTYHSATHSLSPASRQSLLSSSITHVVPVPPRRSTTEEDLVRTETALVVVERDGTIVFWRAAIAISDKTAYEWKKGDGVRTGKEGIVKVACSAEAMTAIVREKGEGVFELSIWDSRESEFTSGEQFVIDLDSEVIDLHWSPDARTLALATSTHVLLFCAQLLDDLSGQPGWITYASLDPTPLTASPISALAWLSSGLVVATGATLGFYSSTLETGVDCHVFANQRIAPLPYHHPQLLFQSLLHGRTEAVIKVLVGLAAQLTDGGDLTPIRTTRSSSARIRLEDFIAKRGGESHVDAKASNDIFSALTAAAARQSNGNRLTLLEDDYHRLLAALKKNSMRGLTPLEHAHLTVVVQTVYDTQRQQGSLDANGLRYLVSMRSFFIYRAAALRPFAAQPLATPRLKYRDAVWAFHSENQELLLDASIKACPEKLTWDNAKALSVFLWLKSRDALNSSMEAVGRSEYIKPDRDDKDPVTASLFYLALRKKHMVITLWKQAGGHTDQRSMLKLLANDFDTPRWRSAALKNAFTLISKRRFLFAAAFFILGDSLKDAVSICLRQLDDFQLAIALARVYEGDDDGPVLRSILEETVLPLAFKEGFRWLASWAFWMLKRRDLAIQTVVTPLVDLAARLPYRLDVVGQPTHEDPCLVLLFAQLRSWSLQTVKGATAVPGHTEFNFVLHMSRVLTRMGCHVLALNLVQSWEFIVPTTTNPRRPSMSISARPSRHSLRLLSTKADLEIPSTLGSRASSPDGQGGESFHRILKDAKVATQAPPEFDMGSFGF